MIILLLGSSLSCSLFRSRPAPYPEGVVFPLAETAKVEFEGRAVKSLVRSGERLYLSTDKGAVHCFDNLGRKILWTHPLPAPLGCPPAAGQAVIAVWDAAGTVHGLDADGAPAWETQLPGTPTSDIALAQDKLYIGTREGVLYALSQPTGEVLWTFKTDGAIEAAGTAWRESVVLASTDGRIYVLGSDGKLKSKWEAGAAIRVTPLVEGDCLYFGADDAAFNCLDLRSRQLVWRQRTGAKIFSTPRTDGQLVYFTASNTVLYALKKSGGDIVWWKILPSRSPYSPELAGGTILAASTSTVLVGIERKTGEETGRHDTGLEARTSPCWSAPDILLALYDPASDKGSLSWLQKLLKVELSASLPQPAPVGAEVVFTASAVGFHLPKYEFFIRRDKDITVTQAASPKSAWTWFPEGEGKVTIGVKVSDVKEQRETEMTFDVANPK
jgi:outer membrane protein assembly factor BamB